MQIIKNPDGSRLILPEGQDEIDILDHIDLTLGSSGLHLHIDKFIKQRIEQKKYDEAIQLNNDLNVLHPDVVAKIRAEIRTEMDKITIIQP